MVNKKGSLVNAQAGFVKPRYQALVSYITKTTHLLEISFKLGSYYARNEILEAKLREDPLYCHRIKRC